MRVYPLTREARMATEGREFAHPNDNAADADGCRICITPAATYYVTKTRVVHADA
jgi:hypothetical protein